MSNERSRGDAGSALVETAAAAPVLVLLVGGLLLAGYSGFAKIWIRYSSYEAVICLASRVREPECLDRLRASIETVLPAGVSRARLIHTEREARARFDVELLPGLVVREERALKLPMPARRGRT